MPQQQFVTMQSSVSPLNQAGNQDTWQINKNYKIIAGTITCYDADGAVLTTEVHDEITIEWLINETNFNVRNQQITSMALKTLLERNLGVNFDLNSGQTMYFTASHISPTNGANDTATVTTKLTLLIETRD